jgi:hypothetical protein
MSCSELKNKQFAIVKTAKYSCIFVRTQLSSPIVSQPPNQYLTSYVYVDLNCEYTQRTVMKALRNRPWCKLVPDLTEYYRKYDKFERLVQIADFENIDFTPGISDITNHFPLKIALINLL